MTVRLEAGETTVTIEPELGGRISSFVVGGVERVVGPPDDRDELLSTMWGVFPMAPWAGRIANGILPWEGDLVRLRRNLGSHSIHGVVFDQAWKVDDASDQEVELSCPLDGSLWPFGGEVGQRLRLEADALHLVMSVTAGSQRMPAACGWHPWLTRPAAGDVHVTVAADEILDTRADLIPTGERRRAEGDADLRSGPALGHRRLDTVFVDAGSPALVEWPDLTLAMSFAPPLTTVVVYTPPDAFCVEPQSAWPDAPRLAAEGQRGTGLSILEPGESLDVQTTWRFSPSWAPV